MEFEYKISAFRVNKNFGTNSQLLEKHLNSYAKLGWKVISINYQPETLSYEIIFERQKGES